MINNYFQKLKLIDKTLSKSFLPSKKNIDHTLGVLKNNEQLTSYFFNNLKNPKWFLILKTKKYFDPKNNPTPNKIKDGYQIPQWNVLSYLEYISKTSRKFDNDLIKIILDTTYFKLKGEYIDNYRTWWYFVKILINIPLSSIPKELIERAILIWHQSKFSTTLPGTELVKKLLPKFLVESKTKEDFEKTEALIDALLKVKFVKEKNIIGERKKVVSLIEDYWLEEAFIKQTLAKTIGEKCSSKPILNLMNNLQQIFNKNRISKITKKKFIEDYSYIWLKDLSREKTSSIYSVEHLFSIILKEMILSKAHNNKTEGKQIIELLLSDKYQQFIFKRIALFVIAEQWDKYKSYFEDILTSKGNLYFNLGQIENELSYLIIKNIDKAPEIRKKIIEIIELGPTNIPSNLLDNKRKEEYINYWKQAWYLRLKSDKEFDDLYAHYKKKTGKDIKTFEEESQWIDFEKSPVSKVDLITWDNKKVTEYIHKYKANDPIHSPTGEGLQTAFKGAVIDNPNKFSNNLDPFLEIKNVSFYTLSSLFDGFKQVWISRKEIDWKNILTAISKLLNNKDFWEKGKEVSGKKFTEGFTWCLSSISELLQEGCKTDDWTFDETFNIQVEEIIEKILINFDDPQPFADNDQLNHALNSTLGKTTTALIYLGLREARLSDKRKEGKESKWNNKLKNNFDKVLENNLPDTYALLGQYLANLYYVDKKWTIDKIKNMEIIKDDKLFISFFVGYLHINNIYNHLYKLMIPSYQRGLGIDFKEKILGERLIHHIATGYIRGFEKLDNGLMQKKYIFNKLYNLEETTSFFWQQEDFINDIKEDEKDEIKKMKEDFKERIIKFWEYVIKLFKDIKRYKEEDQKVLSELSKLTTYCSEIGKKEFNLIKISAPYVTVGFDSSFFIKSLNALKDKGENKVENAKYVAQLYILMLEGSKKYKGDLPDFDWKDIDQIINYLYSRGNDLKELANKICILYAESGNLMLRDLYEENNK